MKMYGEGFIMAVTVSPLDLLLDDENPRFVILSNREQAEIRKYLVTYEDACQLATAINSYGGLLPGERIVVLQRDDKYVVVEGNRRTCALQILLSRELIPDGFRHKIPAASSKIIENCQSIEADVLPDRDAALELMTKRHIEGVKQWKPIAKKQFSASLYQSGQSIQDLSRITGMSESEIKSDIRDYKFFTSAYNKYREHHPDFLREIVNLKIDPFLRIFKAKFYYPAGNRIRPINILRISYDEEQKTTSQLNEDLFEQVVQLVFQQTIVTEQLNTRNVLIDVNGIIPLLEQALESLTTDSGDSDSSGDSGEIDGSSDAGGTGGSDGSGDVGGSGGTAGGAGSSGGTTGGVGSSGGITGGVGGPGGPAPGGPPPRNFFETIRWEGKLKPAEPLHEGLLSALNELYKSSTINCGRQKAYQTFPVATGMILRTVYEQSLKLRLNQVLLWGTYCSTLNPRSFPTLSGMEDFIKVGANKTTVLPKREMVDAFDRVIASSHREFLNANIHNPGNIRVSPDALEGIACGGMFRLIQSIIDILP
jgi:hypothetical protein